MDIDSTRSNTAAYWSDSGVYIPTAAAKGHKDCNNGTIILSVATGQTQ